MAPPEQATNEPVLGNARRWAITLTVMLVSVLQILDTSITNVALPHIQGALSAGLGEHPALRLAARKAARPYS